jgi:hypothetical protein
MRQGWEEFVPVGRIARGNTPPRSVRVPDDVWTAAKAAADHKGESVSEAVVRFLRRYGRS